MRTVLDLLRLLADRADGGARDGELDRVVAELAASEPEAGALTLRVRAAMDAGRRRESELAALVGIARDLASESDPGSVLQAIVRRARGLLGTDVAYLTLHDPERGDTFMRVTSGSVSHRFQTLRLPLGAGLGGLVAAGRTPHWTGRYAGDGRYRHTEEIDTAVAEEGIVGICGTPLLVDDEFVGVLFAAHRSARPFTAAAHGPVPPDLDAAAAVRRADERDGAGRPVPVPVPCAGGVWVTAAITGGQRLGTLLLGGLGDRDVLTPGQVRTVERAAVVTALVLLFAQRADEADRLDRADALAELLATAGPPRPATLTRLAALGVSPRRPYVLLVCRCRPARRRAVAREAAVLGGRSGLVAERGGAVVVLLPGTDPAAAGARLARRASEQDPDAAMTVGGAGPLHPADGADAVLAEARRSAEALVALDREGECASAADLGFAGLLLGERPDVAGYVRGILGPVAEHDERRGSDLLRTLEAYYAAGASPTRAAAALHVHVDTVAQRLDRVGTLLGPRWQDPDHGLELQLALRLHRLGTPRPEGPP